MLAHDQHQSFEDPPGHAMFRRESKGVKKAQDSPADDSVMLSIIHSMCSAITPSQSTRKVKRTTWSPMKMAELRSTYIKQLSELRSLNESAVLSVEEYEEQRKDVIDLMRQLKENNMTIVRMHYMYPACLM